MRRPAEKWLKSWPDIWAVFVAAGFENENDAETWLAALVLDQDLVFDRRADPGRDMFRMPKAIYWNGRDEKWRPDKMVVRWRPFPDMHAYEGASRAPKFFPFEISSALLTQELTGKNFQRSHRLSADERIALAVTALWPDGTLPRRAKVRDEAINRYLEEQKHKSLSERTLRTHFNERDS